MAIVDDHTHCRLLVRRILQAQGKYELFEAEDGKSALTMIRSEKPDLVILDLMMPEMDGLEATRIIRERETSGRTPIMM